MKTLNHFFRHLQTLLLLAGALAAVGSARSQTADGYLGLKITSPAADTYRLTWYGQSGKQFQVQSTPDLFTWSDTGPVITGAGGAITVDDGPVTLL